MSTTWRHVAAKDFEDAVRSKLLWGITLAIAVLMAIFMIVAYAADGGEVEPIGAFTFLGAWSQFFVPLIALIVGYMALVGERRSGSLRVLMSYPFSRLELVTGKVLGRALVVSIAIASGFVAVSALAVAVIGVPPLQDALAITLLTLALGLTFTATAVGISAGTRSRGAAMALAVGVFFLLFVLWDAVAVGAYFAVTGSRPGLQVEPWYLFVRQLNPIEAFRVALSSIAGEYVWPLVNLGLEDIPAETATDRRVAARVDGDLPFYLEPWMAGIVFAMWAVVPTVLGYARFRRTDIA